jgi:hypothetical protein
MLISYNIIKKLDKKQLISLISPHESIINCLDDEIMSGNLSIDIKNKLDELLTIFDNFEENNNCEHPLKGEILRLKMLVRTKEILSK